MTHIIRYFGTSSSGKGDGTTWADRMQLNPSNTWNSFITSFNFSNDSLECRIGPGTYTINDTTSSISATRNRRCWFIGCDSDGNPIVPDDTWKSTEPYDSTGYPILTRAGAQLAQNTHVTFRCIVLLGTGNLNNAFCTNSTFENCVIKTEGNTTSTTSHRPAQTIRATNCSIESNNTSMIAVTIDHTSRYSFYNCRFRGNDEATGGQRNVILSTVNTQRRFYECSFIHGERGLYHTGSSVAVATVINCLFYNCGDSVFLNASNPSASTTAPRIHNCIIVNSTNGINASNQGPVTTGNNRLRNNTSANYLLQANLPSFYTENGDTSSGVDSEEFESPGDTDGDFSVKGTSTLFNQGFGPKDRHPSLLEIFEEVWENYPLRELTQ